MDSRDDREPTSGGSGRRALGKLPLSTVRDRVDQALRKRLPPAQALQDLALELYGPPQEENTPEYRRFYIIAAQIARHVALESEYCAGLPLPGAITPKDVKECMGWTETFDRLAARMIDLHYFAGLSVRRTAEMLEITPAVVLQQLRFSRTWFQVRLTV